MSSAFVKEGEYDLLKDVAPNMASLLIFLKREYGGSVHELSTRFDEQQREIHELSDGLCYRLNEANQWQIVL